ncbi:MAG TPA: hypothetical protein VF209_01460, partial [Patescibacteria group bacterium]
MSPYRALINEILELDDGLASSMYLSLYIPTATVIDRHLKTLIRSTIVDTLRSHPLTEPYHDAHQRIASFFERKMRGQKNPKTLGVFARLSLAEIEHASVHAFDESIAATMVDLPVEIGTHTYLGKTFDLRPLFLLEETSVRALVVKLSSEGATIYTLVNGELNQVQEIENIWAYLGESESYVEMNMGTAGKVSHGTGYEAVQRRQLSGNQMVLNRVQAALEPYLTPAAEWKQLVFFISDDFSAIIGNWAENELTKIHHLQPIISSELPKTKAQIIEHTHRLIQAQQKEQIDQLLALKNKEFHQWATGWKEVTEAVRNRQVDTLLISPDSARRGFISQETLPYVEKTGHSRPVQNLAPWLTKIVYQTN